MTDSPANKKQLNKVLKFLLRDAIAYQAYFGNNSGLCMYLGDINHEVSPVVKYFLSEKDKKSLKTALYLDALGRTIKNMRSTLSLEIAVIDKMSFFDLWKTPLFIPDEIKEHIMLAMPKIRLLTSSKEEETIVNAIIKAIELNEEYNITVIGALVNHIKGSGIIPKMSYQTSFKKIRQNKEETEKAFKKFSQKLSSDDMKILGGVADKIVLDDVLQYIIDLKMGNVVYDLSDEERELVDYLFSYKDGKGSMFRLMKNEANVLFNIFSKRSLINSSSVANGLFSFSDMLLFSEKALINPLTEDTLSFLNTYEKIIDDKDDSFKAVFDEIAFIGDNYDNAYTYAISSDKNEDSKKEITKSIQLEGYTGFINDFISETEARAKEKLNKLLERESQKKIEERSIFAEDEKYAFLSLLYIVEQSIDECIYLVPLTNEESFFKEPLKNRIKGFVTKFLSDSLPIYNKKRKEYIEAFDKTKNDGESYQGAEELKASELDNETDPNDERDTSLESTKTDTSKEDYEESKENHQNTASKEEQEEDTIQEEKTSMNNNTQEEQSQDDNDWGEYSDEDDENDEKYLGVEEIEKFI